ncbi:MAG: hypothetical protein H6618_04460 [Deltaproteobacteria bacterium]|nr:hypothetical protein [Deltaproteobacteria bacterium]
MKYSDSGTPMFWLFVSREISHLISFDAKSDFLAFRQTGDRLLMAKAGAYEQQDAGGGGFSYVIKNIV